MLYAIRLWIATLMTPPPTINQTNSISAISENDLELANKVIAIDDEVDNYFAEMRQHLTTVMQQKPQYVPQYVDYLMIAKYVERIADHSTNIAQWVMFVVKNKLKN